MVRLKSEALVGIFVVAAFALFLWGTMRITHLEGKVGYAISAVFQNVSGLEQDSPVRMNGVKVGRVKQIRLAEGGAVVQMEIVPDVSIPVGSVFSVASMGVLGDKYVAIEPGKGPGAIAPGATVRDTKPGPDLDRLLSSLESAGGDLAEILAALKKVVATDTGVASMQEIVENVRQLSHDLAALVENNSRRVDSILAHLDSLTGRLDGIAAENREEIRQSIANIRDATASLKQDLPVLMKKVEGTADEIRGVVADNREDLHGAVAAIRRDAEKLEETLASVTAISRKIESGEGTIGKLVKDESAYNNLNSALEGVNKALKKGDDLKINVDLHANYLTELESTKGYATIDFMPSPDKFYRLEVVDDSAGERLDETEIITTTPPGTTVMTQTTRYKDALKFSLEIGKRFHDTSVRLGFIESAFGVGMDRYLNQDNLRLTAEMWDFNRPQGANSRFLVSWRFLRFFHLDAGGEDFFNDDRDPSFLVGVGLTFVDDDLKYLLASAPSLL